MWENTSTMQYGQVPKSINVYMSVLLVFYGDVVIHCNVDCAVDARFKCWSG